MTDIDLKEYLRARFDALEKKIDEGAARNERELKRIWDHIGFQDTLIDKLNNKIAYACGACAAILIIIEIVGRCVI